MNKLHNILKAQLIASFGSLETVPEGIHEFIGEINNTYYQFDAFRLNSDFEESAKEKPSSLNHPEEGYKFILSSIPDLILVHIDGIIKFVNKSLIATTGYTTAELLGHHLIEFVQDESREVILNNIKKKSPLGTIKEYEIELKTRWGETKIVLIRGTNIIYDDQNASLIALIDITDRKQMELALNDKVNRLELLKLFFFGVSSFDLSSVFKNLNTLLPKYLPAVNRTSILLFDEKLNALVNEEYIGFLHEKEKFNVKPQPLDFSISGKAFQEGKLIYIPDCSLTRIIPKYFVEYYQLKSTVAIPILFKTKKLGILRIDNLYHTNAFSQYDIDFFSLVTEQLGILIENSILYSEQKKIETIIKDSEERYRVLVSNMPEIVFVHRDKILFVNKPLKELTGIEEDELLEHSIFDFLDVNSRKVVFENMQKRFAGENVNDYEVEILFPTGIKRCYIVKAAKINYQNQPAVLVVLNDITERKNYIDMLENSEKRFRSLIENGLDIISVVDDKGDICYESPSLSKILGYQSLMGMNIFDFMHPEDKEKGFRALLKLRENHGEVQTLTTRVKHGDGSWISFEVIAKNLLNDPVIEGIVVNCRDITERNKTEEELRRAHDELEIRILERTSELFLAKEAAETAVRIKSEFLAQMSHEIRTPLNIILNFNSLIKYEINDLLNEDMRTSFDSIERASKRLIRTIDLILNMSEIQTKSYEPCFRIIDLSVLLESMISEFRSVANSKNIELVFLRVDDNTFIYADEYTVMQIYQNLIDNAIKYTKKGYAEIKIYTDNHNVYVGVRDTGIGISEDFLPKLFTPFSQQETGYTRRFEGTGLGLALVKQYIEINNGSISVESKTGKGSLFTTCFPLVDESSLKKDPPLNKKTR